MLKSKGFRLVLRLLIGLLGAGIGAAMTAGIEQIYRMTTPDGGSSMATLVVAFIGMSILFGTLFFLLSNTILNKATKMITAIFGVIDSMPLSQLFSAMSGLIIGLVIAALVINIFHFLGDSIFTTSISAIMFVTLGAMGYTIGYRRSEEIDHAYRRLTERSHRTFRRNRHGKKLSVTQNNSKLLDVSSIVDGRLPDIRNSGFLEGTLIVPRFVKEELNNAASSADPTRSAKGKRGLMIIERLLTMKAARIDHNRMDISDGTTGLLRLASEMHLPIVTADYSLQKEAEAAGIRILNVNELAGALRPMILQGEQLVIAITKEGRESAQGVGYLDDGTMVVVEGGRSFVGQSVEVTVTTTLQTNAGRMIFARINETGRTTREE